MKINFKDLSDFMLNQEHDIVKTIFYKLPYQDANNLNLLFDDFTDSKDFTHLSNKVDLLSYRDIILKLSKLGVLTFPPGTTNLEMPLINLVVNKQKIKQYMSLIDREIEARKGYDQKFCRLENNTFFINLNDGSEQSITFHSKNGDSKSFRLFQILFEDWLTNGKVEGSGIVCYLSKQQINRYIAPQDTEEFGRDWIKYAANSIRDKIKIAKLDSYISLGFDNEKKMYFLIIRKI